MVAFVCWLTRQLAKAKAGKPSTTIEEAKRRAMARGGEILTAKAKTHPERETEIFLLVLLLVFFKNEKHKPNNGGAYRAACCGSLSADDKLRLVSRFRLDDHLFYCFTFISGYLTESLVFLACSLALLWGELDPCT